MISDNQHQPKAAYDEDGNIILPSEDSLENTSDREDEMHSPVALWTVTDENSQQVSPVAEAPAPVASRLSRHTHDEHVTPRAETVAARNVNPRRILSDARTQVYSLTQDILQEGVHQYRWSFKNWKRSLQSARQSMRNGARGFLGFLTQPVWVISGKQRKVREYSRGTLFVLDTVRFGGTFAVLFAALFVSLNYESFWQVVSSYADPLRSAQATLLNSTDDTLKQNLLKAPSLPVAGNGNNGDLLSFLPPVGPPENRIIIPKLDLNVPLVTPSYKSLLSEDWDNLETDIQDALQMGVVHYPGTARPGQAGNFFVTGHSSYYPWAPGKYKTVFARLHELDVGDEYWVYYGGDKHRYIIQSKKEVKPNNVDVLDQPVNARIATLMTCTPIGTALRRLIITAQEVDPNTGAPLHVGEAQQRTAPDLKVESLPI